MSKMLIHIVIYFYIIGPIVSIGFCDKYCLNDRICSDEYFDCITYQLKASRPRGPLYFASIPDDININCGKQYFQTKIQEYSQLEVLDERIVGGWPASKGEFPWMVSLQKPIKKGHKHFCAGSIISDFFILTAAHCADK